MSVELIIRELVKQGGAERPWHGADISHYAPMLKSDKNVLSITAVTEHCRADVTIPFRKVERASLTGDKRALVDLLDDALDRLHAQLFPKNQIRNVPRAPRPPKGWRLFGRRRAVVLA